MQSSPESVTTRRRQAGIRAHAAARSETLNYKIAEGVRMKVPYLAGIGKREAENDSVALRMRGAGKKQDVMTVADLVAMVEQKVLTRALTL